MTEGRKSMKPVTVRNVKIGKGMPKICVPIVGVTKEEIYEEAKNMKKLPVDLVEWRGDWFADILEPEQTAEVLGGLRKILGRRPILFTFRTKKEGGEKEITAEEYEKINRQVIATGNADRIDVEIFIDGEKNETEDGGQEGTVERLIREAHAHDVKVIASSHDFEKTPPKEVIISRLMRMQDAGADIAKIAVMPKDRADVLTLLSATEEMCREYARCPVVTMSMSARGVLSRLCGEVFGSAITFASAGKASAPGQMDVDELKEVLKILHKNM